MRMMLSGSTSNLRNGSLSTIVDSILEFAICHIPS